MKQEGEYVRVVTGYWSVFATLCFVFLITDLEIESELGDVT